MNSLNSFSAINGTPPRVFRHPRAAKSRIFPFHFLKIAHAKRSSIRSIAIDDISSVFEASFMGLFFCWIELLFVEEFTGLLGLTYRWVCNVDPNFPLRR